MSGGDCEFFPAILEKSPIVNKILGLKSTLELLALTLQSYVLSTCSSKGDCLHRKVVALVSAKNVPGRAMRKQHGSKVHHNSVMSQVMQP